MKKVTIYSTPICPYCRRAKELFKELNINFEEVDLASNDKLRSEMIEKYNWQTVPMIFIGEEFVGGFDDLLNIHLENKLTALING